MNRNMGGPQGWYGHFGENSRAPHRNRAADRPTLAIYRPRVYRMPDNLRAVQNYTAFNDRLSSEERTGKDSLIYDSIPAYAWKTH